MANPAKGLRFDPYRNFRFKVLINEKVVAGLSKMTALKKTTEAIEWWEAGSNFKPLRLPGKTKYEPITMEKGLTTDTVFETWANLVNSPGETNMTAVPLFRKKNLFSFLSDWVCSIQPCFPLSFFVVLSFDVNSIYDPHEMSNFNSGFDFSNLSLSLLFFILFSFQVHSCGFT